MRDADICAGWSGYGNNTAAQAEATRTQEVLELFRDLVKDYERGVSVREYTPEDRWWWP